MGYYLDKNINDNEAVVEKLKGLPKSPGICFFIDLVNSTNIKYTSGIDSWGLKLNNTFKFISFLNDISHNIVKGIGDEIMVFIPDNDLGSHKFYHNYYSILSELYSTLYKIKNLPKNSDFLQCKVGIHYCDDVYNISFLKGYNDYYGKDIDLTARLMSKTRPNRIVLSEEFYKKIKGDFNTHYYENEDSVYHKISGKYIEDFKGVPGVTEFRVLSI